MAGAAGLALGSAATGCKSSTSASSASEGEGGMTYRINPGSGDRVSLLGYGCMRWPMIKDDDGNDIIDQEIVNKLVDRAMEAGVNYYDTSPVYLQGQSEKASGLALSRYPRSSYYIATKLSNFADSSRDNSIEMYHASFEQMFTDYFDYYLLHSIGRGGLEAFNARYVENGMMDFLLAEREAGRIRNLGFSFHGKKEEFDALIALHDKYHWDFVQIQMNYVDWTHADGVRNVNAEYLYAELDKRELPIVIMEPLQGGRLASVPANIADALKAREPDRSVASWAFRFVGSYPRILCVLSGMTNMEVLNENIATYSDFKPLNDDELAFLEKMADLMMDYPMVSCNNCNYCMPCPRGVDIPGIFRHYNGAITDGTFVTSREHEDYFKMRRAYLLGYSRAVPVLRQADHCIGCGECLVHCPQSIDIPKELRRIDRYVERLKRGVEL